VEGGDGTCFKVAKGAPQAILSLVDNKEAIGKEIDERVNVLAAKG